MTTFVMTPGGITLGKIGNWVIPTKLTLIILMIITLGIGIYQLIKGFGRQPMQWSGFLLYIDLQFSHLAGSRKITKPGWDALQRGITCGSDHPGCIFRYFM